METLSESAVTFLVNAVWQISALLLIALACARLLRNASARRQYLFWVTVFVLSVGLPIFSLFTFLDGSRFIFRLPFTANQPNIEKPGDNFSVTAEAFSAESNERIGTFDVSIVLRAIAICYFLFLFYRLFRLLRMWRQTRHLRRSVKNEQLPPLIETIAGRCRDVFQINSVPVFFSAAAAAPLTLGALKPVIILPENFSDITSEQTLISVLGHESAHIRRGDYGWNLIFEFLSLPVAFHPAVTIMKRNINQTREMACDELVAEFLLNPLDYARSLVQIAGFITPSSHNAITLGVFSADVLEKRIMKMIQISRGAYRQTGKIRFLLSIALLGMTAMATTVFALALPGGQTRETEKTIVPETNSIVQEQEKDAKIINGGVINGKAVSLPKPEYPDEAKKAGVGGTVTVQVIIDEEGNVASAAAVSGIKKVSKTGETETATEPEEAPEKKLLNESAENAAKQAKFAPTLLSGKPVKVKGIIVYNFVAVNAADDKTISGGVLNGKAISLPAPEFPAAARAVAASGNVTVQVTIDEEGNVTSAELVSGHPLLRQSAVKAAREAKFAPTFLNGQPVKIKGVLIYNFAP